MDPAATPAEAPCTVCGRPLDALDRLLGPVDAVTGLPCCLACLDGTTGTAGMSGTDEAGGTSPGDGPTGHPTRPGDGSDGAFVVGVRELRNQVAAVVRRAAAGERIIVTVDGRPMAQLGPITAPGSPTLSDLAAAGLVEPPRSARPGAAPAGEDLPVDVRLDRVLEELRGR